MEKETTLIFKKNNYRILNIKVLAKKIKVLIKFALLLNIFSDKHFLDIILRNLLTNAIKFTPKNGEITIELENIFENSVEILIKDTGIGIAPKLLDDIFKNGKTITTLGTENEKGSGLGLVLCKEFAIKNGGNIRFKSLENSGTSVYFSIPTSSKQTKLHLLHDFF